MLKAVPRRIKRKAARKTRYVKGYMNFDDMSGHRGVYTFSKHETYHLLATGGVLLGERCKRYLIQKGVISDGN